MNAEAQVLQALDAAQDAFRRIQGSRGEERARVAEAALRKVSTAPWSMVADEEEADMHGWLGQMRDALLQISRGPGDADADRLAEEGLWAANELERDLRTLVGAR